MPSSIYENIDAVLKYVTRTQPSSVLDIGVGFGKWGMLLREYLDVYHLRIESSEWATIIDGVEICEKYIKDHQYYIYDRIMIGPIQEMPLRPHYDLVIACDVLEHIKKEEVLGLLKTLKTNSGTIIISMPLGDRWLGTSPRIKSVNPFEEHISSWSKEELLGLGFRVLKETPHPRGTIGLFVWESE